VVHQRPHLWILYYTATTDPTGGHHTVMAMTSNDLTRGSQKKTVFLAAIGKEGWPTESPFVVAHNGKYFLFVCTNRGYTRRRCTRAMTRFIGIPQIGLAHFVPTRAWARAAFGLRSSPGKTKAAKCPSLLRFREVGGPAHSENRDFCIAG